MLSIVLAAGKGTRMKSNIPKVLHKVNGKTMLEKVNDVVSKFGEVLYVLGHQKEKILGQYENIRYVEQKQQLGTGHAVKIAKDDIKNTDKVLITYGDSPLLTEKTIDKMLNKFKENNLDCLVLTCIVDNPTNYGRILKKDNQVLAIVEEKEADEYIKSIKEINTGVYIFKTSSLLDIIDLIDNNNKKGEYYLTDAIKLLNEKKYLIDSMVLEDKNEILGVNSRKELEIVSNILRQRKLDELMENGVSIIDTNNTYIEDDVIIGKDTIIYPNTIIQGKTIIGENCEIYSSRIVDSIITNEVHIDNSLIESAIINNNVNIGPYAHLRKGTILNENVKVGNFVEIKNSILFNNVKAGHLTYIGDSEIGERTNIGAGTITCNYDGTKKHKTVIGSNSFIGSNTILVSPVEVGNNVLTAAGSVITKNVDDDNIAFGRARQVNIKKRK